MSRIEHKRVGLYACIDPENKRELRERTAEVSLGVNAVYQKPKWKLAQIYWDYEPSVPLSERRAYQNFENDASSEAIDILNMWSLRQLSRDRDEIVQSLALLRKYNITLHTYIEEINSSIISDALILDLWFMGIGQSGSEPLL